MVLNKKLIDNWYVLYTFSKHEKKIATYLDQAGIEFFLPLQNIVKQWSDRKRQLTLPLFPNYLFVKTNASNFWKIRDINGVIRFVNDGRKPIPVSSNTIHSIQKVLKGNFRLEKFLLGQGERVKVVEGPFAGVEGKFVRYKNKNMLVIEIELVNSSVMLEINPLQIKIIE